MAPWSLELAYDSFPKIEEEFSADLDDSLRPRSPDLLFDLVAGFDFQAASQAVDVGCGEGRHMAQLADRFGFSVTGVDPVSRHVDTARCAVGPGHPVLLGTAEQLPVADASADLIWCRDVLVHVEDLARAFGEFCRVLRPGGRALIYQMFATDRLEPREAAWLWDTMGVVPASADPGRSERAMAEAGLRIDQRIVIGSEWGEWSQEQHGTGAQKLLHAARLLRRRQDYAERYGRAACEIMLGDSLWHVYSMIGKLERRIYVLVRPGPSPTGQVEG